MIDFLACFFIFMVIMAGSATVGVTLWAYVAVLRFMIHRAQSRILIMQKKDDDDV